MTAQDSLFAGYRLGPLLGGGGFGRVFRTELPGAGLVPPVCIKIGYLPADPTATQQRPVRPELARVPPHRADSAFCGWVVAFTGTPPAFRTVSEYPVGAIFAAEAGALRSAPLGLLPRLYASGEAEGLPFAVMEYIPGESLRGYLRRRATLDLDRCLLWLTLLVDDLARLGRHGDLKPDNLVITECGLRLVDPAPLQDPWGPDGMLVTAEYNPWAESDGDVRALAIMLYELLTGVQPFAGQPILPNPIMLEPDEKIHARRAAALKRLDGHTRDPGGPYSAMLDAAIAWIVAPRPPELFEIQQLLRRHVCRGPAGEQAQFYRRP